MTKHITGTRSEWLAARVELLKAEKEHTRRSDELARRRQDLPWVRIEKTYRFETDEGRPTFPQLGDDLIEISQHLFTAPAIVEQFHYFTCNRGWLRLSLNKFWNDFVTRENVRHAEMFYLN